MSLQQQARQLFPLVTEAGRDEKAWAKRIMWREQQGDKELLMIQVRFAKEALSRGSDV